MEAAAARTSARWPLNAADGLRVTFTTGEIIHIRPSGNAPELRCYAEADSQGRAAAMNRRCLEILAGWRARLGAAPATRAAGRGAA